MFNINDDRYKFLLNYAAENLDLFNGVSLKLSRNFGITDIDVVLMTTWIAGQYAERGGENG